MPQGDATQLGLQGHVRPMRGSLHPLPRACPSFSAPQAFPGQPLRSIVSWPGHLNPGHTTGILSRYSFRSMAKTIFRRASLVGWDPTSLRPMRAIWQISCNFAYSTWFALAERRLQAGMCMRTLCVPPKGGWHRHAYARLGHSKLPARRYPIHGASS